MRIRVRRYAMAGCLGLVLLHLLWTQMSAPLAQMFAPIETQYLKQEFRIPMRDGARLFTAVYAPRDASRRYPILMTRTPYSVAPYGAANYPASLGPSEELSREGFIFVYQDVRGAMMSEGDFVNVRPPKTSRPGSGDVDESSDTFDTIAWLLRNIPNHNGNVGLWGISYPGFYAASGMIDAHPALKAVSPQAPIADWFVGDDFHHNGAFFLAHAFGFLANFGQPRPRPTAQFNPPFSYPVADGYEFYLRMGPLPEANAKYFKNKIPFWNALMRHGNYDDFWQARNLRPHMKNIRPAVMTVGGWFDAEDLFGTLAVYQSIEASTPNAYNILVMGPWFHGGWARSDGDALGDVRFDADTAAFYRREIEFPFFMHFLKGAAAPDLPEAYVFESGKNAWRRESHWPPRSARTRNLHFCADSALVWDRCPESSGSAFDEYVSDPQKPVPYINGIAIGMTREYMVDDQRFASRRADVLVYATEVLDADVTIAGPIKASLNISTTGTDADFIVKLIDVYPDGEESENADYNLADGKMRGYQQLVRGEPFRAKFRNSFSHPEPLVPEQITRIEYVMPDILHTFRKGHRIMVQVQSSWFPLVDRNPQQFVDIYKAKAGDFKKATQRLFHSHAAPSFIALPQLN